MIVDPVEAKQALRALLRQARPGGDVAALIARIAGLSLPDGAVVAGLCPLPGEPALMPAWSALHDRGYRVVMPETTPPGSALRFRLWRPGDALQPGRFNTRHPQGPVLAPDVVFVPLLCWDLALHRLGYGGGYYDRTLSALPMALSIGFGFEAQRVRRVPTGPFDVTLRAMVTEARLLSANEPTELGPTR